MLKYELAQDQVVSVAGVCNNIYNYDGYTYYIYGSVSIPPECIFGANSNRGGIIYKSRKNIYSKYIYIYKRVERSRLEPFSKRPLNFTMYLSPLVKRPQRISTEKMFFSKMEWWVHLVR